MALEVCPYRTGTLPNWLKVRQQLYAAEIGDIDAAVAEQFQRPEIAATITPGMRVAVGAGSRGSDRYRPDRQSHRRSDQTAGRRTVHLSPMGSHGGATPEGNARCSITTVSNETTMGCPIKSSMETVELGIVEGDVPVLFRSHCLRTGRCRHPVGRVKPHTDFYGRSNPV